MADLNECCEKWLWTLEPRDKSPGQKTEAHTCPKCRTTHKVEFQCSALLGGRTECTAVGTE
jgi:hypothetical protein